MVWQLPRGRQAVRGPVPAAVAQTALAGLNDERQAPSGAPREVPGCCPQVPEGAAEAKMPAPSARRTPACTHILCLEEASAEPVVVDPGGMSAGDVEGRRLVPLRRGVAGQLSRREVLASLWLLPFSAGIVRLHAADHPVEEVDDNAGAETPMRKKGPT